jgi:hypothetical protein
MSDVFEPVPKPADYQPAAGMETINEVIADVPMIVKESKAGYKTSEFWLTIAISAFTLLNGIPMPEKYEGFVIAAMGGLYALSRGLAKKGIAHIEVPEA